MSNVDTTSPSKPSEPEGYADFEIAYTAVGAVAEIVFSRPPQNHFSPELLKALADNFEQADADPAIRATLLASEGPHFCTGADLIRGTGDPRVLYEQAARLFAIRKPIVAAVQGAAIGGGLGLAVAADFRIVSPTSRLAANFVKLGTHPGFALTYTLPLIVGSQLAADMFYTGRRLTGDEAVRRGLADRIAPEGEVRQQALALATEIAENAPLAVEATRATLRTGWLENVMRQTDLEAEKQIWLKTTNDFSEGVRAVAERRPGVWTRR